MTDFLLNFYGGADQAVGLASALGVWIAFAVFGGLAGGDRRLAEADPFVGWALVALIVTTLGVAADVPFRWTTWPLVAAAPLAALALWRRDARLLPPEGLRILLLGAPMLLLISAMMASQWDEFSHWLPSARHLYVNDRFPDAADPVIGVSFPAYPYGWPLVRYIASRVSGRFVEIAGAVTNVLILLTFGLVVVRLVRLGLGRDETAPSGWTLCALGGLAATLLNPTFVQKVALTAYADVATAAAVGLGGVLGWRMLGAIADETPGARSLAMQFGLVMMLLVNLKQATFVLFVLLVIAVVSTGVADRQVRARWPDLLAATPWMVLPPLLLYGIWRYHVAAELPGAEMSLRPLSEWFIELVPDILAMMGVVLAKKGGYLGVMVVAVVLGARGVLRMRTPLDRLAVITGAMFLAYNAFLLLMYVAAFGRNDSLRVASLWRYNMHLGLLCVAFAAYGLAAAWQRSAGARVLPRAVGTLAIVLMVIAPVVFASKLRFDRDARYRHFRTVGAESAQLLEASARYYVLDPTGSGESAVIVRYEVARPEALLGYVGAFHDSRTDTVKSILKQSAPDNLIVFSSTPQVLAAVGVHLDPNHSYLLAARDGQWDIVHAWPHPRH